MKFSSANGLSYDFFRAESFETTRQCHQTVWGSEELLEPDSWTSNRKKVKDERLRKSSNCSSTLIKIGSNHGKCSIPSLNTQSCIRGLLVVRDFCFWAVLASGPILKKKCLGGL